jgi:hypothetical protein
MPEIRRSPAEKRVEISGEAVADLARVPELEGEYEAIASVPVIGSMNWSDRAAVTGPLGERPGATASMKLAVAIDHAENVRQIAINHQTIPTWAHLTICRPVFEASVQVRWLLDARETARERVGRAVGVAMKDLDWRSQIEDDMRAAGWTPSPSFKVAGARKAEVRKQAKGKVTIVDLPGTATLMEIYRLGTSSDAWLFRYTSGVLHSQGWASALGDVERFIDETRSTQRHEANMDVSLTILGMAARHLGEAVKAYRLYMEPATSDDIERR